MGNRLADPDAKAAIQDDVAVVQVVTPVRVELHRAIRLKAAEEGTTIRVLVMRGLRAIGLPVSADDETDRRRARGNRRNPIGRRDAPTRKEGKIMTSQSERRR